MEYVDWILSLSPEVNWFLRVCLSALCGGLIGFERDRRYKEAGVRTHTLVCLTGALVMITSKYGFMDLAGTPGYQVDPSKLASGVITGIGFLGAGLIFVRNQSISGLTTAAGIWGTAGIGMAVGSGLLWLGVLSTLLVLTIQICGRRFGTLFGIKELETINLRVKDEENAMNEIETILNRHNLRIVRFEIQRLKRGVAIDVVLFVAHTGRVNADDLYRELAACDLIMTVRQ